MNRFRKWWRNLWFNRRRHQEYLSKRRRARAMARQFGKGPKYLRRLEAWKFMPPKWNRKRKDEFYGD